MEQVQLQKIGPCLQLKEKEGGNDIKISAWRLLKDTGFLQERSFFIAQEKNRLNASVT